MKTQPLVPKSIKFNSKKLKLAKDKGVIKQLPQKCREALDSLLLENLEKTK